MIDILSLLPAKRKHASSGWWSFNAVCCHHRGHRPDSKGRAGVLEHDGGWSYACFNCGFKVTFTPGATVSFRLRQLLVWLGVDDGTIEMLQLEAMRHRSLFGIVEPVRVAPVVTDYPTRDLPAGFEILALDNPRHSCYTEYLTGRGIDPGIYPFMVNPDAPGRYQHAILIPFTHRDRIVGWSHRFIDDKRPKYINESPPGYVFGLDLQQPNWTRVLVVEGVLDAILISGVALMHNDINDTKLQQISQLGREVVVVPDRDSAGMTLVDRALTQGWAVSFPEWAPHVKDCADAVKIYGRMGTLITISEAITTSSLKIQIQRRKFAKGL